MTTGADALGTGPSGIRLDPDTLAELEREQAFLLRSLDDLDAEHAAGDITDADHAALGDDYTRRLAEVARSIEGQRLALADHGSRFSNRQRMVTIVGVSVLALVAGLLLARASGFRSPTDTITGGIRDTSTNLLAEADTLTREGRWEEAIDAYTEVLDIAPANVEALTYRGWMASRLGQDARSALADLDEAITIDPDYPDARVFRAIVHDQAGRYDLAGADIAALDEIGVPPEMAPLIDQSGLRASILGGQIASAFPEGKIDLDEIAGGDDHDRVVEAGLDLLDADPVTAVRVWTAVLDADADHVPALIAKGSLLAIASGFAAEPDVVAEGMDLLDRAVELEPASSEYRLYRAYARNLHGDREGAVADMAEIDPTGFVGDLAAAYDELAAALG